jgi:hypothetical protein
MSSFCFVKAKVVFACLEKVAIASKRRVSQRWFHYLAASSELLAHYPLLDTLDTSGYSFTLRV